MRDFEGALQSLTQWLNRIGVSVLIIMMFLIVANVLLRIVYKPILGTPELVSYGLVVVVCFGLAYTAILRGHVSVDLLVSHLPQRMQAAIDSITSLLSIGVFSVIAWQNAVYGWEKWLIGERSPVLGFPVIPFRYVVVFGCTVLCLALLLDLCKSLAKVFRK